jgi:hypothetical protein
MNNPPSTTSSPRRARRALITTAAALTALAVPGTAIGSGAPELLARVSASSATDAVRFQGPTFGDVSLPARPVRSQIEGLQGLAEGLPSTTVPTELVAATPPTTPPTSPPTTVAPATTTTAPPPAATPAAAPAATAYADPNDPATWDRLARCEASGNWYINTGNGYYGGLQFSGSTWRSVGGTGLPHEHSRETQIEMGKRLLARTGWKSWPSCTRQLGYR